MDEGSKGGTEVPLSLLKMICREKVGGAFIQDPRRLLYKNEMK